MHTCIRAYSRETFTTRQWRDELTFASQSTAIWDQSRRDLQFFMRVQQFVTPISGHSDFVMGTFNIRFKMPLRTVTGHSQWDRDFIAIQNATEINEHSRAIISGQTDFCTRARARHRFPVQRTSLTSQESSSNSWAVTRDARGSLWRNSPEDVVYPPLVTPLLRTGESVRSNSRDSSSNFAYDSRNRVPRIDTCLARERAVVVSWILAILRL